MYKYVETSTSAPLSSLLFEKIQKDILSGEMKSGDKLTEQKICDRYKVSRTPVREALRQLEKEGLIENIPNRGAFVLGFSKQEIRDMLDLRTAHEMLAVKWAVERMSDKEMEDFGETFDFMEFYTAKGDLDRMISINSNFHKSIYEGAHNRMLQQTLSSYQLYIRYGSISDYSHPKEYLEELLEEHRKIYEAMKARDAEAAMEAMKEHMLRSKERRSAYL